MPVFFSMRVLHAASLTIALFVSMVARAESGADKFYRAYYLETSAGDFAAAGKLYAQVVGDAGTEESLRADAKRRLAGCEEEVAASDLARLMPAEPIAYVELNRPGEQVTRLLDQLGLLATARESLATAGPRVAISPALIKELLGLRGVGVAVTGINPQEGIPTGVAVVNPGNVEVVRELLISALPAGAKQVAAVGGFATYDIEGQALITITNRLIVVGTQRDLIEDVLDRLKNPKAESLATNPTIAPELAGRGDSLLYFCVNAKPILPMLNGAIAAGAGQSREAAMIQAMFDPNSLETFSGRVGVRADGIGLDISLRLAEGHRNRVFNLIRNAPLDPATLKDVPSGAAAFVAGAFNSAKSTYSSGPAEEAEAISAMDFGREVFANIVGFAAFVLPPDGAGSPAGGLPIPDAALVLTVHDPAKSRALWSEVLGLGSVAAGTGTVDGVQGQIDGQEIRSFRMPEGLTVNLAVIGKQVILTPSDAALRRVLAVKRGASNILQDESFTSSVGRVDGSSTLAAFAHAGRCAELAKRYIPPGDAREMSQFTDTMTQTVASVVVGQSNRQLNISARVSGVPKIGGLVAQLLAEERAEADRSATLDRAIQQRDWKAAAATLDQRLAENPNDHDALWKKLGVVGTGAHDAAATAAIAEQLFEAMKNDPSWLNDRAWALLTEKTYQGKLTDVALRFATRANELTAYKSWAFVDTLAWAHFEKGDKAKAVELERKALELAGQSERRGEVQKALERFEAALQSDAAAATAGTR